MMSREHAKEVLENLVNNEDIQSMLLRTDIDAMKCAISALSTIEKIRAEIQSVRTDHKICWDCGERHGVDIALAIIDKHIGGE